jgi:hypothetical protein
MLGNDGNLWTCWFSDAMAAPWLCRGRQDRRTVRFDARSLARPKAATRDRRRSGHPHAMRRAWDRRLARTSLAARGITLQLWGRKQIRKYACGIALKCPQYCRTLNAGEPFRSASVTGRAHGRGFSFDSEFRRLRPAPFWKKLRAQTGDEPADLKKSSIKKARIDQIRSIASDQGSEICRELLSH